MIMRMIINCFLISFFLVFSVKAHLQDNTNNDNLVVRLSSSNSKIRGHILQSAKGQNYYAFQQVPYASPPIGNLRFKPPQKPKSWNGILDTTNNTKICVQIIPTTLTQDEDCLFVNVYTPVRPKSKPKLAVYVWIHGGANQVWDATIYKYGPQYLIDYNIVVVTVQYRLGAFGFLSTEDGIIQGNLALKDQNLALRWVQENIHLFGGDPKKVTIGGESSGSSSVSMHVLSPLSKGLFRGAIQESGSALCTYSYQNRARYYAFKYGQLLDSSLKSEDSNKLLQILQKANVSDLVAAQTKVANEGQLISLIQDLIWTPTIETSVKKTEAFIYEPMHKSFRNGNINRVPILIGFNKEEMLWFLPGPLTNDLLRITWDQLDQIITNLDEDPSRLINNKLNIKDTDKFEAGTLIKKLYTNTTFANDKAAYVKFAGDIYFSLSTIRQAQLTSQYVPAVFLYEFSYTPYNKSIIQGAEHTEELPYLWHNVDDLAFLSEYQPILRQRMLKLWTNFIKYQNPTPDVDEDLEYINWPTTDPNRVAYLSINETLEIRYNPKNILEYDNIVNKFVNPPYNVY